MRKHPKLKSTSPNGSLLLVLNLLRAALAPLYIVYSTAHERQQRQHKGARSPSEMAMCCGNTRHIPARS
jgi:hypothetical protein